MHTRVRMQREFLNRLIEKYFEQLIGSVQVLWPHCRNFKANDFKHYCAAASAGTYQAHMRWTDELVHQIWRNRFVYSWVLTQSRSVSLKQKFYCFCMFWLRHFTKFIQKFHIWNNQLSSNAVRKGRVGLTSTECSSSCLIVRPLMHTYFASWLCTSGGSCWGSPTRMKRRAEKSGPRQVGCSTWDASSTIQTSNPRWLNRGWDIPRHVLATMDWRKTRALRLKWHTIGTCNQSRQRYIYQTRAGWTEGVPCQDTCWPQWTENKTRALWL